jgi:hypothetical protein
VKLCRHQSLLAIQIKEHDVEGQDVESTLEANCFLNGFGAGCPLAPSKQPLYGFRDLCLKFLGYTTTLMSQTFHFFCPFGSTQVERGCHLSTKLCIELSMENRSHRCGALTWPLSRKLRSHPSCLLPSCPAGGRKSYVRKVLSGIHGLSPQ